MSETLLNFYTSWSLAHASIVVATVFGLFSLLRIISDNKRPKESKILLAILYCLLLAFGFYEVERFKFFGEQAQSLAISEFGAELWDTHLIPQGIAQYIFKHSEWLLLVFGILALIFAECQGICNWIDRRNR